MPALLPTGRPLTGPHLRLTPFAASDAEDLAPLLADPALYAAGYVIHRRPRDPDDALALARERCVDVAAPDGGGSGRVC